MANYVENIKVGSGETWPVRDADAQAAIQTLESEKAPKAHASAATTYGIGTGSNYGHVRLSDSTSSTSEASAGVAASPKAVKAAYDLANTAKTSAATAQSTADGKMPIAGGRFTGEVGTEYKSPGDNWVFRNIVTLNSAWNSTGTQISRIIMIRK